jgi:hypothetical protein
MTPEEIKQLLEESQQAFLNQLQGELGTLKAGILSEVDRKNSGLASSLQKSWDKKTTKAPEPEPELEVEVETPKQKLSLQALQKQIEDLKEQSKEKDRKIVAKELENILNSTISKFKPLDLGIATKAFKLQYGDNLVYEDGVAFVKNGDTVESVDEALGKFLETDFGKSLLPPTSKARGAGLKPQNSSPAPTEGKRDILEDLFIED